MSTLAAPANGQPEPQDSPSAESPTIQSLRVYKDVCHRIRNSLVAGRNEIVSPTTISRLLVKEKRDVSSDEAPSAESPGGAMEHSTTSEESCPFLEAAEGWTIEFSGGGCEVSINLGCSHAHCSTAALHHIHGAGNLNMSHHSPPFDKPS